jgi:rare lipoprotein A
MLRTVLLLCLIYSAFVPSPAAAQQEIGLASFYAAISDRSQKLSAAHRTLPFGSMVRVTRVDTGAHVDVRINDRGPFIRGRIIDVSRAAAEQIGMIGAGVARVHIQVIPSPPARLVPDREAAIACYSCSLPLMLE